MKHEILPGSVPGTIRTGISTQAAAVKTQPKKISTSPRCRRFFEGLSGNHGLQHLFLFPSTQREGGLIFDVIHELPKYMKRVEEMAAAILLFFFHRAALILSANP